MNYYSHHIGDYLSATAHLSLLEHGAYRRLIDVYYINESPLPAEMKQVYRLVGARSKEEKDAVDSVLGEFFERTDSGWHQNRCDHEIALCNKNRTNGKRGGRPPKNGTQPEPKDNPNGNPNVTQGETPPSPHHPITPSPDSFSEKIAAAAEPESTGKKESPPPSFAKERADTLAARLSLLESKRLGRDYRVSGTDERVAMWGVSSVTDPQFREAYDIALARRSKEGGDQPISPRFMTTILASVLSDEGKSIKPLPVKEWHETAEGVERKAAELGVPRETRSGMDPFPAFKARVFAAAGMQAVAA